MNPLLNLYLALVALFPYGPARQCLVSPERREIVVTALAEAQRLYPQLPPEIFVTVGWMETHVGCDRYEGGNWGAPISARQRHVAGPPLRAAAILWRSYEVCSPGQRTERARWLAAARRFRTGLCVLAPEHPMHDVAESYATRVWNVSRRILTWTPR